MTRGGITSGGKALNIMRKLSVKIEKCLKRHPADFDFSHDTLVIDDLKQNISELFNVSVATILGVKRKIQ